MGEQIFAVGSVVQKPYFQMDVQGKLSAYFWIVINRFSYSKGHWDRAALHYMVCVRGPQAEFCRKHLQNGFPVAVEGTFEDSADGPLIIAEHVHLFGLRTAREES